MATRMLLEANPQHRWGQAALPCDGCAAGRVGASAVPYKPLK